jgi:predicted ATPase
MKALSEWHIQGFAYCQATIAEAMSLADSLTDLQALAIAQFFAAFLAHFEGNAAEVERLMSALIELATRQNFAFWLPGGKVFRGWAQSACGNASEGISWIEEGIEDWRATGAMRLTPYYLAMKAEALHLAKRDVEALEAIKQARVLSERFEERWWCGELHRLRAVFLKAIGAEANQIEVSLCEAIRIARDQKSSSLATRAEATYAEYHGQKREP